MRLPQDPFSRRVAISFAAHLLLIAAIALVPRGSPTSDLEVYSVALVEAPSAPQVRELRLSTDPISSRETGETPSSAAPDLPTAPPLPINPLPGLRSTTSTPPAAPDATREVTEAPRAPSALPPASRPALRPRIEAERPAAQQPTAPSVLRAPSRARDDGVLSTRPDVTAPPSGTPQSALETAPTAPPPPAIERPRAPLPALPEAPRAEQLLSERPASVAPPPPSSTESGAETPQRSVPEAPAASALDTLRPLLESRPAASSPQSAAPSAEANASQPPTTTPALPQVGRGTPFNPFDWRQQAQGAIQQEYDFPASFSRSLNAGVRIRVSPDGTLRESPVVIDSSGNVEFDRACVIAIRRAKLPSMPEDMPEDRYSQTIRCTP